MSFVAHSPTSGRVLWSVAVTAELEADEGAREALARWLGAHGIDPTGRVTHGSPASVVLDEDLDVLLLQLWVAVPGPDGAMLSCPTCPACVQQMLLRVALREPPPPLPGPLASDDRVALVAEMLARRGG